MYQFAYRMTYLIVVVLGYVWARRVQCCETLVSVVVKPLLGGSDLWWTLKRDPAGWKGPEWKIRFPDSTPWRKKTPGEIGRAHV